MEQKYKFTELFARTSIHSVPRALIPKSIRGLVRMAMYDINDLKESVLPIATALRNFMAWRKPALMVLLICYFLSRASLSFLALDANTWAHWIIRVIDIVRNSFIGIIMLCILFSRSRALRILLSLCSLSLSPSPPSPLPLSLLSPSLSLLLSSLFSLLSPSSSPPSFFSLRIVRGLLHLWSTASEREAPKNWIFFRPASEDYY